MVGSIMPTQLRKSIERCSVLLKPMKSCIPISLLVLKTNPNNHTDRLAAFRCHVIGVAWFNEKFGIKT